MINFKNFSIQYPEDQTPVLDKVNLSIFPGSLNLLTGASGSGKSTLLRCINGLVPHFTGGKVSGEIQVNGRNPIVHGPAGMSDMVGFVFQDPEAQFIYDIVEDEIAFVLENAGIPPVVMQKRVDDICNKLGLNHIRQHKLLDLSGGEKQLVAIASVLVGLPGVILLDEPTSQLDPQKADEILQVIVNLKQQMGLSIVIAEHRLERLLPYTDQIIHIPEQGGLIIGSPEEIMPRMMLAPPIVEIGRKLHLSPLPITIEQIPDTFRNAKPSKISNEIIDFKNQRDPLLELKAISVDLGNRAVLNNVRLTLYPEEILALIGPNGAGKTTLLRAILGLTDSRGEIIYSESVFKKNDYNQMINNVGYLPQNPNDLLFAESILEELKITLKNHDQQMEDGQLHQFLEEFQLADKKRSYPRDLSVGERQRAALAAITVNNPSVIFLDEPTRGLDYTNKAHLIKILKSWRNSGKSILVITHDVEFAAQLADRVAILENGSVIYQGSPKIAFTKYPAYRTQTSSAFPDTFWITPVDIRD